MSDQIALLSFYLAMVTLLCATFFVRLDSWFGDVLSLDEQVHMLRQHATLGLPRPDAIIKRDLRLRAVALKGSLPIRGFRLVSAFILALSILSIFLGATVDNSKPHISTFWFVYFPGLAFLLAFFLGATYYIRNGTTRVITLIDTIKKL